MRFSFRRRCLHPYLDLTFYAVVKQLQACAHFALVPRLRRSQPCWLGWRSALLHKAQQWRLPCLTPAVLGPCSLFGCQTASPSARGSRAIHLYTRPTSFSRANGTVGVEAPALTSGRAGDSVFSIFLPISPHPAQNCAQKRVGWRRQDPPRPGVAVRFKLQGQDGPATHGQDARATGTAPRRTARKNVSLGDGNPCPGQALPTHPIGFAHGGEQRTRGARR